MKFTIMNKKDEVLKIMLIHSKKSSKNLRVFQIIVLTRMEMLKNLLSMNT